MLTVISPAKTLDYDTPPQTKKKTQPEFIERSAALVEDMRQLGPDDIRRLMGVSEALAELNHERYAKWDKAFTLRNAKQAVLAFKGDVYLGLEAESMDAEDLAFAQRHLRILSGLYGVLRPLDLIQPYRLEMGLSFANSGGKDLYAFWGSDITDALNAQLVRLKSEVLVNLASNEYFRSIRPRGLEARVVTPVFKDLRKGKYRVLSFFAKKARGRMARAIIDKRIDRVDDLKRLRPDGYRYNPSESSGDRWVFTRDETP